MTEVSPVAPALYIDPMPLRKTQNVVYVRPSVRESKTVLDPGLYDVDSGF